jgi:hypothetical protein
LSELFGKALQKNDAGQWANLLKFQRHRPTIALAESAFGGLCELCSRPCNRLLTLCRNKG